MTQPFFAEQADIQIDPVQRPERADRIGAILQHMRRPNGVWRLEKLRQRPLGDKIVELLVGEVVRPQGLAAPALGRFEPRRQVVDRIHRARIVDVVAGHQRGVQRAGPRSMQELKEEGRLVGVPRKNAIDPKILRADRRAQILPLRRLGVRRRLFGVGTDMTEPAGHSHAVGSHQLLRQVVVGVFVKPLGIPFFYCGFVEIGVGEEAQSDDPRRVSVIGPRRDVLAARADRDAGVLLGILERVWRAIGIAHVDPQTITLRVRSCGLRKTRLVDEPEIIPPVFPAVFQAGIRGQDFQEVEISEGQVGQIVPQPVVAAGPDDPHVAPLDLVGAESNAAIHRPEIVLVGRRERLGRPPGLPCLVDDRLCPRFPGEPNPRRQECDRQQQSRSPGLAICHSAPPFCSRSAMLQLGIGATLNHRRGTRKRQFWVN